MSLRIVTNSERTTSACERKWAYRYVEGIVPKGWGPAPLRQGTLVHHLLGAWYREGMPDDVAGWREAIIDPWLQGEHSSLEQQALDEDGVFDAERWAESVEIADEAWGMFRHYVLEYGAHDRAAWEVLGVGLQAARFLGDPRTRSRFLVDEGGRIWVQGGETDLLVRERDTGLTWIVEHKTTQETKLDSYCRKLLLDPQIRGYAWAIHDPIASLSDVKTPIDVAGVLYNVLRKAVPREPEPLKPRKEGDPSPGLSRDKRIVTTAAVYRAAIQRHGFNPDNYLDILQELERKRFFARERVFLSPRELRDWHDDAAWWAIGRMREERAPYHPRQVSVCQGVAPQPCAYASICLEDGAQSRASYVARSVRHEELRGELASPWPTNAARPLAAPAAPTVGRMRAVEPARSATPEPEIEDPFA